MAGAKEEQPKTKPQPQKKKVAPLAPLKTAVNPDRVQHLIDAGVHPEMATALVQVSDEYGLSEYYGATVGLAENIRNPRAIGDAGCSFGAYQFNQCVGTRKDTEEFGMSYVDCAKDYLCSTRMLYIRIEEAYDCSIGEDGYISNWQQCLSNHNGFAYPDWYAKKIAKNGFSLGLH